MVNVSANLDFLTMEFPLNVNHAIKLVINVRVQILINVQNAM